MDADRFTGRAETYKKYRSSYPVGLIDYLYLDAGFYKGCVVADAGSGTGIFSRFLLERGSVVYCVEPNADMRRIAEADLKEFINFHSIGAPAEDTGLAGECIDFVTAAQAFHWFDAERFKGECRRILKPGGKAALIWNTRDSDDEFIKRDYAIREKYCVDKKGLGESGGPPADVEGFFNGGCEKRVFDNTLTLSREAYAGMNLSRSYSPREDKEPEKYRGMLREMEILYDEYQTGGALRFPQHAVCFIGFVL